MAPMDYEADYEDKLVAGKEYETWVVDIVRQSGITIDVYQSKKDQWEKGESRQGIEIKYDIQSGKTNNFFVETYVRPRPDLKREWSPGSLFRGGAWAWVIGDYARVYFISVKSLLRLVYDGDFRHYEGETMAGFIVPIGHFERYASKLYPESPVEHIDHWLSKEEGEKWAKSLSPSGLKLVT